MEMELNSYQTAETEWRYFARLSKLSSEIGRLELELEARKLALEELKSRPPLTHLFNWSA